MMTVYLNEKPLQVAELTTLQKLLMDNQITAAGKAAAINDHAVPPGLWAETMLHPGDRILIFRAFYGG
ncbi:MAG: sulfur carrier protein ThiS [Muribaculaceae bacterium]|nr:sulfur carrier protein ThiS [Bacteroides sp.]MBD5362352.1 sulfur carrier protein ThiS [Bacteroides sp.]MBD5373449.1 sulfur carrier protein ThiS [Bacteroides sp.]MDE6032589.1 sulfur carrier protein ThiS [Muribaculaceae bacterium]